MENLSRKALAFYTEHDSIYVVSTTADGNNLQVLKVSDNGGNIKTADVTEGTRWSFNWENGGFIFELYLGNSMVLWTSRVTRVAGVRNFMPPIPVAA